ncbi:YidC/Oxa1 family membrane protein insertase [Candidatus Phytoplasma melaleucae]|uniref:YidC/Oxa1 family membrane protein insertase n=1 Tax=Candidatus Phytoplasma melaleucae TaxID=2982630 RepID=A0ABT9DEX3_9MOLU|nr:YidC/Oxa1 family membrane protein insertase ['Melaleuca sp.' phytoplasma]MDO8168262.1 YidC/Oxa1 family membrane protein insertase ['Melaleuca sp.' phytoplasma]
MNQNKFSFKRFFIVFLLIFCILNFFRIFFPQSSEKKDYLINYDIKVIFKIDKIKGSEQEEQEELIKKWNNLKKISDQNNFDFEKDFQDLEVFIFNIKDNKNIMINALTKNQDFSDNLRDMFRAKIAKICKGEEYYFSFNQILELNTKINILKKLFTVSKGINRSYFCKRFQEQEEIKFLTLKQICLDAKKIEVQDIKDVSNFKIFKFNDQNNEISSMEYNDLIRQKHDNNGGIQKGINTLVLKKNSSFKPYLEIFVDDTGDLPIQWPSKLKWGGLLGYIWNVLIICIGSFLYFFSNIFSYGLEGFFFGNLGLGIILTTVLVRTLSWPIYTKTNTFSLNMSLAQPEINKIQAKYALKRDPVSLQQMQIEIMKVYKKYNFNIFAIFISFLQMPIFFAMLKTLNRFRVSGGIFNPFTTKPFLGFIYLKLDSNNNYFIYKLLLSGLVGITMFFLNKVNLKKPYYAKQNNFLTLEQKAKQKNQEQMMQVISYCMIFGMMFASFKDVTLSLYWIIGNLYTIFQTMINHKIMANKYIALQKM